MILHWVTSLFIIQSNVARNSPTKISYYLHLQSRYSQNRNYIVPVPRPLYFVTFAYTINVGAYNLLSFTQTKQTIKKLQLTVSSDGRFRNLRDALRRSEPPCIPYLGMYLSDLSFIEEGTPNFTDDGLLNFSKMRMVGTGQSLVDLYDTRICDLLVVRW